MSSASPILSSWLRTKIRSGPSPLAIQAIADSAKQVHLYPDGNAYYLKADLAKHLGVSEKQLILTNGSNEVLQLVGETYLGPGDEVIYAEGAFVVYGLVAKGHRSDLRCRSDAERYTSPVSNGCGNYRQNEGNLHRKSE